MTDRTTTMISVDQFIAAPPAKVWRALTEPKLLAEWLLPVVGLRLEPGAAFTFRTQPHPPWDGTVSCRLMEIEPFHRLRYTWSVPHLDTRIVDGKASLLFGPYAGLSPRFLKHGGLLDLPLSVRPHNLIPLLAVAKDNFALVRYLIRELTKSKKAKFGSLQEWMHTDIRGWTLADHVDDEQYDRLLGRARISLSRFVAGDSTVRFPAPALIATATVT